MDNRKKELIVSNRLIKRLKQKGFKINRYYAHRTKSIYLKLDYGVCGAIRISDHIGKKQYRYKFNVIKKYTGPKIINDRGYIRLFYNYNNTEELLHDVETEKKKKINKYGLYNYQKYMKMNSKSELYKSFKKVA